jgi:hypothetical protein
MSIFFFAEGSQGQRIVIILNLSLSKKVNADFRFKPTLLSGLDATTFSGRLAVSILTALGFGSSFLKLIKLVCVFRKNCARPARTCP